jgi:hypothetical protein
MSTSDATPNAFLALLCKDADGLDLMPILAASSCIGVSHHVDVSATCGATVGRWPLRE